MSKYGQKFEKHLDALLKFKLKRGLIPLISAYALYAASLMIVSLFLIFEVISDETYESSLSVIVDIFSYLPLAGLAVFIVFIVIYLIHYSFYNKVVNKTLQISKDLGENENELKAEFKKRRKAKDREWIIQTTNHYYDEAEHIAAEAKANQPEVDLDLVLENGGKGDFDGWLIQKLGWMILGALVTACTLGLGFPVAYVWILRWQSKHSLYDGRRLSFDGKASQLVGKWICWVLLCIPTFMIYALFIPKKLLQWKASHLHIAGEVPTKGDWNGNAIALSLVKFFSNLLTIISLWILKPVSICWKNRYIQRHMVIDGRTIDFDGKAIQIMGRWILWNFLTVITFGIYIFFRNQRVLKWVNTHTHIKDYAQPKVA